MSILRLYAVILLLAIISGLLIPVSVTSEQKILIQEPIKPNRRLGAYPFYTLVPAKAPTRAPDIRPLKVDITSVISRVVARQDPNNDRIEDLLVQRILNGFYKPNDTITALVLFKMNPPADDIEANMRLRLLLEDISRRLVTLYPQVKVLNTYTYAVVGMKIQLPANLTLLREVTRYLSTIDLNNDGIGDLWLIEDTNKERRLYNYYSGKALYIRPWIYQDFGINGSGVTASVSDTGIDDSHAAFQGKLLMYWSQNTGANLTAAYDPHGHGTHVSGTVAGYYASTDAQGRVVVSWGFSYDYSSSGWYSLYEAPMYVDAPGTINVTLYQTGGDAITRICLFYTGDVARFYAAVSGLVQNVTCIDITQDTWNTLTYDVVNSSQYGFYYVRYYMQAGTRPVDTSSEYWILAWPVNSTSPNGIPYFSGVAYGAKLVVANIFYDYTTDPTVDALNWIVSVRTTYNITTHNMSWGYTNGTAAGVEAAVTQLANSGVIPVVAAGNDGVYNNTAATTSPAENCFAITVAALDQWTLNVTSYSSGGGNATDYPGTVKPDLASIGGWANGMVLSADTNDAEDYTPTGSEVIVDDTQPMMGTSMAAPHVTGIMTLASAAYRQYLNTYVGRDWDWNSSRDVLFLKNLALISTFETYPLTVLDLGSTAENETAYSPTLDKGGKDTTEGYGVLDAYALLYAIMTLNEPLKPGAVVEGKFRGGTLAKGGSTYPNIFDYGPSVYIRLFILNRTVTLPNGTSFNVTYKFQLILNTTNVSATDFDLYLYNYTGEYTNTSTRIVCGEPILLASSTNGFGANETITYTPPKDNWPVWVVVKRARMDSIGGKWILVTSPSVEEYGRPYQGATFNASNEAWIGWPIKINGSMTKDITRVVVEIFAQNGTRLARLDSANGDITIVDPAYYSTYNTTWLVPFDNSLVGTYLTVVAYFYDSTGTLAQGPVATQVYVNQAPEPIPEPVMLPMLMVSALIVALVVVMVLKRNKF